VTERRHPDTALTGYVTGALAPAERAQVDAHLGGCVDCRRAVEESQRRPRRARHLRRRTAGARLGRYRADLRARVERAPRRAWWARPLPAIIAAGGGDRGRGARRAWLDRRPAELATVEETVLGARLPCCSSTASSSDSTCSRISTRSVSSIGSAMVEAEVRVLALALVLVALLASRVPPPVMTRPRTRSSCSTSTSSPDGAAGSRSDAPHERGRATAPA
jgi:hypothetical protein